MVSKLEQSGPEATSEAERKKYAKRTARLARKIGKYVAPRAAIGGTRIPAKTGRLRQLGLHSSGLKDKNPIFAIRPDHVDKKNESNSAAIDMVVERLGDMGINAHGETFDYWDADAERYYKHRYVIVIDGADAQTTDTEVQPTIEH